jgi:hypothetical protein
MVAVLNERLEREQLIPYGSMRVHCAFNARRSNVSGLARKGETRTARMQDKFCGHFIEHGRDKL